MGICQCCKANTKIKEEKEKTEEEIARDKLVPDLDEVKK